MNLLITGIHGFVGTNLVTVLQNEYTIYGLDIVQPIVKGVKQTFRWDELEQLPPIDAIIHLAGKAHDTKKQTQADLYFKINTDLTQKIFDFFLQSTAKKFIFFSSVKAAADFVIGNELTEDVIPTPKGPYGESKIKAEEYILDKLKRIEEGELELPKQPDKKVYILRPCMIHGPGNKGNLNLLYSIVEKGFPWPLGDFENCRSFTSIDNLCFVVEYLMKQDVQSGIYNIADDEALSTNELIRIICDVMGNDARIWRINKNIIEMTAKIGTTVHFPLNMERLAKLTENYVVSNRKIKQALSIESMPVKARDGLIKTIRSFLNNK